MTGSHSNLTDLPAALGRGKWRERWGWWWPCGLIVLIAMAVRVPLIDLEFGRNADGTGSFYALMARNYLRGTGGPLGMPTLSVGVAPGTLYAHHPPLVPWLTTVSLWALGDRDYAVRLPPTVFVFGSVIGLFALLRPCGAVAASVGAAALAFVPMSIRFGQMPDVINAQIVFGAILVLAAYLRAVGDGGERASARGSEVSRTSVRRCGPLFLAFGFAAMTDWPAFFLVPPLVGHLFWTRRWWLGFVFGAYTCVWFAGIYCWCSLAAGDFSLIIHQFLNRATQAQTDDLRAFTWGRWFSGVWKYNVVLHTVPLMVVACFGWAVARWGDRRLRLLVGLSLAWAVLHALIGRQGNLNHDWWWWPSTLAVAVSAASAAAFCVRRRLAFLPVAAAVALSGWWTYTELSNVLSPFWMLGNIPTYSSRELGEAVRRAAPDGGAVMVFSGEDQPYTSYNADRPLLLKVWDEETFRRRFAGGRGDLFYNFSQGLDGAPVGFVIPKENEEHGRLILPFLRRTYPVKDLGKFWGFDLTRPLVATPEAASRPVGVLVPSGAAMTTGAAGGRP